MKKAPVFDRKFLIELSNGMLYREAEALMESGAVESAEWDPPILRGQVVVDGERFCPELNLRSTVFAENKCTCLAGRRRQICVHAIACALYYQAIQSEDAHERLAQAHLKNAAVPKQESAALPEKRPLQLLNIRPQGTSLALKVYLPPNLSAAISRDAIVTKLEAAYAGQSVPLGNIDRQRVFACEPPMLKGLQLIESWCGGKLPSLLQLTASQLSRLLQQLVDCPQIFWLKGPSQPIAWRAGQLEGVTDLLPKVEDATQQRKIEAVQVAREGAHLHRSQQLELDLRRPSVVNRRRQAEAKSQQRWRTKPGDFPTAAAVQSSMADYGEQAIVVDGSPNFIVVRLPQHLDAAAQTVRSLLKAEGFRLDPRNRKWWLRDRHKTLNFLAAHWSALKEQQEVRFTQNFEDQFRNIQLSSLSVQTESIDSGYRLSVQLDETTSDQELQRALASGKHYIEQPDGSMKLLNKASVEQLHQLERAVSGQADRPFSPSFQKTLHTRELFDVEFLVEGMVEGWQPPEAWQARSRALKQVAALQAAPIRAGLDRVLRGYQCIGVAWLWHLYRNQLGGILADEMGLGKTIQALALIEVILSTTEGAPQPVLVVCPASLIENWAREAQRFVPDIRVLKHHGANRCREIAGIEAVDLVITSYGILRQDLELLSCFEWALVIADEAQHIKNRRTQNAKSLYRLHSQGRILLTGTPIENSLDDLLALFEFLMPGYLQSASQKLSMEERDWHRERQSTRAAAYILRRTKKEVAPELPDKIEKTFFCEFGDQQAQFYQSTLEAVRKEVFQLEMAGANSGKVRFAMFKELLRLRQVCVDPRILDESYPAVASAKLAAFDEILQECMDVGSRILVFSSFVSALKLLAQHLEQQGHRYAYLDGQTKNRQAICDQFNQDTGIPVFLISLKAGGTGLNLTGADTVVHYDPWWNPAAEAQATDRAHRIGQQKVVTSIKLIATNTVEEKVLELQTRKSKILDELFEASSAANATVDLAEMKRLLD